MYQILNTRKNNYVHIIVFPERHRKVPNVWWSAWECKNLY